MHIDGKAKISCRDHDHHHDDHDHDHDDDDEDDVADLHNPGTTGNAIQ